MTHAAGRLEQLRVDLDLHQLTAGDRGDTGRIATSVRKCFRRISVVVSKPARRGCREGLDTAKLDREDDGTADLADRQVAVGALRVCSARKWRLRLESASTTPHSPQQTVCAGPSLGD